VTFEEKRDYVDTRGGEKNLMIFVEAGGAAIGKTHYASRKKVERARVLSGKGAAAVPDLTKNKKEINPRDRGGNDRVPAPWVLNVESASSHKGGVMSLKGIKNANSW